LTKYYQDIFTRLIIKRRNLENLEPVVRVKIFGLSVRKKCKTPSSSEGPKLLKNGKVPEERHPSNKQPQFVARGGLPA